MKIFVGFVLFLTICCKPETASISKGVSSNLDSYSCTFTNHDCADADLQKKFITKSTSSPVEMDFVVSPFPSLSAKYFDSQDLSLLKKFCTNSFGYNATHVRLYGSCKKVAAKTTSSRTNSTSKATGHSESTKAETLVSSTKKDGDALSSSTAAKVTLRIKDVAYEGEPFIAKVEGVSGSVIDCDNTTRNNCEAQLKKGAKVELSAPKEIKYKGSLLQLDGGVFCKNRAGDKVKIEKLGFNGDSNERLGLFVISEDLECGAIYNPKSSTSGSGFSTTASGSKVILRIKDVAYIGEPFTATLDSTGASLLRCNNTTSKDCETQVNKGAKVTMTAPSEVKYNGTLLKLDGGVFCKNRAGNKANIESKVSGGTVDETTSSFVVNEDLECGAIYRN